MYGVQERMGSLQAGLADIAQKLSAPAVDILTVWVDDKDNIYRDLPAGMLVPRNWMVGRYAVGTPHSRYEKDLTIFRCVRASAMRAAAVEGARVEPGEAIVASTASCYTVARVRQRWEVHFQYHHEPPQFAHLDDALSIARQTAEARWELFGLPSAVDVIDAERRRRDDIAFGIWLGGVERGPSMRERAGVATRSVPQR